jgi:carbonic anhydrase
MTLPESSCCDHSAGVAPPRRTFLKIAAAAGAAGVFGPRDKSWALAGTARADNTLGDPLDVLTETEPAATAKTKPVLSPEAALAKLMDGNQRFVEGHMTSFQEDVTLLKQRTAEKQEPFAAVLSCADSRVPVELIFDQSIGRIFVTRLAGNIASTEAIASLEYGVAVLGTRAILVLGHGNCGAVKASIDAKAVPGQISALYRYIRPAVDQAGSDLEAAIRANARIQAALLRESSPVIAKAMKAGAVKVTAAYYDLRSGKVTLLD